LASRSNRLSRNRFEAAGSGPNTRIMAASWVMACRWPIIVSNGPVPVPNNSLKLFQLSASLKMSVRGAERRPESGPAPT
jgi:hypothetical protein